MSEEISDIKPNGEKYPVSKSNDEWKNQLTDFEYYVLRQAGTEPAWSGKIGRAHV